MLGEAGATVYCTGRRSRVQPNVSSQVSKGKRSEAHMSVLKTRPTKVSAESHIAAIANEEQRNDSRTLVALMREVTKEEPRMWGPPKR